MSLHAEEAGAGPAPAGAPRKGEDARPLQPVPPERLPGELPALVYATDAQLRLTAVLGAALGAAVEARGHEGPLEGRPLSALLAPGDGASAVLSAHHRALAGETLHAEAHLAGRPVELRVQPLRDARGRCVGTLGLALDVTGRPRGDEALRASEERLRTVIEASPDPIFLKDGEGRWMEANSAALRLFGLEGVDYRGRTDADLSGCTDLYRDALLTCVETDQRTWRTGRPARVEETVLLPDGSARHFDVFKVPLFHPDGRRKSFVVLGRDITDRKRAEEERDRHLRQEQEARAAAEEARRRSEFLAAASRVLAGSLDYGETLAAVTRLGVPFLGEWCALDLVTEAAEGRGGRERVVRVAAVHLPPGAQAARGGVLPQPTPLPEAQGPLGEALRSGQASPLGAAALAGLAADEGPAPRAGLAVPLVARGRTIGALLFASREAERYRGAEVTLAEDLARVAALAVDNARLYRESQEAIRARDEFLSVASHELRTPLTSLHMRMQRLLQLARDGALSQVSPDALVRILENAERQDRRLGTLVQSLLDVSRLGTGHLWLEREEVDLAELARDVAEQFSEVLTRAGATLHLQAPAPVVGRWDRSRLEQVVTNLLSNALKYGPEQPIEMTVRAEGDEAVLEVRDRGIGIPPERLPHIFERFERAVSTRHYGGLGLGLFIVRELVERHGGTVEVESAPGKGARFTVRLPRG